MDYHKVFRMTNLGTTSNIDTAGVCNPNPTPVPTPVVSPLPVPQLCAHRL